MEGDEKIGLMLGRASRLRLKISEASDVSGTNKGLKMEYNEEDSLFAIREAIESLEAQLACLQALQQRQRNEREAVLTKIDHSRKTLLIKLEEYKGDDIEVIHEAAAFASETAEQDDAFFVPPYPNHHPDAFVVTHNSPSFFDSKNNPSKNGLTPENSMDNESYMELTAQSASQNKERRMRSVWGFIAKSAISFVGLVFILSLASFKTEIRRKDTSINLLNLLPQTTGEVREVSIHCPPGKVLVIENGKASCLVKERVEVPFGSDLENSNINIAFG